jgi:hypothetical protein
MEGLLGDIMDNDDVETATVLFSGTMDFVFFLGLLVFTLAQLGSEDSRADPSL